MDPATRFEVWSRATGLDRAADNHYPTEFWADILARPPPLFKHAILFCWTTRAQLNHTVRNIEDHWDYTYKNLHRLGQRAAQRRLYRHRQLRIAADLFARQAGVASARRPGAEPDHDRRRLSPLFPPVVKIARSDQHSEKPEYFAESIERLWLNTPKIEMYYEPKQDPEAARGHIEKRKTAGWDLWPLHSRADARHGRGGFGGAPAILANAFVRPRVNDGERQRPLERLANGLLS